MCEYCDQMKHKKINLCGDYDFGIRDVWIIESDGNSLLVLSNIFGQASYFGIKYCPMCGRKLDDWVGH